MKIFILTFLAVIAVSSSEGKPKFEFNLEGIQQLRGQNFAM